MTSRVRGNYRIYELAGLSHPPGPAGVNEQGRLSERGRLFFFTWRATRRKPTKVQYLDRLEESVLATEILHRPLAAVILDVREAAGPKYVVIAAARRPIEVRHSPLIVHHVGVSNEVRSPGGFAGLQ